MGDVEERPITRNKKSIKFAKNFKNVEILWASTREPLRVYTCSTDEVPYNYFTTIYN